MSIPPISRIVKWLIFLGIYFQVVAACVPLGIAPMSLGAGLFALSSSINFNVTQVLSAIASSALGFLICSSPFVIIGGLMAVVGWAYQQDKKRERIASDDFKNNNLLYRYGYKIYETTLPIPVKPEWTDKEIEAFVEALRQKTASQIQSRFASAGVQVANPVTIKDKDLPSDNRNFLRVIFHSKRGSQASHFITYSIAGKYVVVHYLSYIRGKYRWHDVVDFVLTGPVSVWVWGIDWLQNQYSIIAVMSRIISNSYDLLDLKTYFEASYLVLLNETKNFLKEKGLLTDELNQIIVNNINNSQNIKIADSRNVNLGGVMNAVQSAARSLVGQS